MRCSPAPGGRVMSLRPPSLFRLVGAALLGAVAAVVAISPAWAAAPITYAALGDSYSSGVGAGGYDSASGSCSRSPRSYTALWARSHAVATFTSAACSGATTADVLNNQLGVLGTDGACAFAVNNAKSFATGTLPARLDRTYAAIRSRAPHATVIVLGYPHLFEQTASCGLFGLNLTKRRTLNSAADTLAGVLAARAAAARDTFVDVRGSFAGHGICGSQPWINSTTWPVTDSYHPTSNGYRFGYLPALVGVTG